MELMFLVSEGRAAELMVPMLRACERRGTAFGCFFTNDGVRALAHDELCRLMRFARQAVACELSWERYMAGRECPVELGSQTNSSAMVAEARHVVSI